MESSIIVLDSSDEESPSNPKSGQMKKRKLAQVESNGTEVRVIKRIKPVTIATNISREEFNKDKNEHFGTIKYSENWEKRLIDNAARNEEENERKTATPGSSTNDSELTNKTEKTTKANDLEKNEISKQFGELIEACRKADGSEGMELLITKRLIRYYETVHPDYVISKSFNKTVSTVTSEINAHPDLVYLKVASIIEELNIRRKSRATVVSNENVTSTGNEKKDIQIRRLNKALYILKKRIAKLEEQEVDFDEDFNSAYMLEEKYKKRAFEIYEKICDITGESKHAHRTVRKPIQFQGTHYREFNRTIQTFVNRTNTFPDYFDVLKCLQHCNSQYGYSMKRDEMTKIAQDAFMKIGKSLQNRRKADLYETVSYYTGTEKDPAGEDNKLMNLLEENKKHYSKIGDIIDKFAKVQDNDDDSDAPAKPKSPKETDAASPSTSNSDNNKASEEKEKEVGAAEATTTKLPESESSGDEEEEDEMALVKENVKPDMFDDIEISDDEELVVLS